MNLLKNNGWKCLWRGHPAQPTDQLKPSRPAKVFAHGWVSIFEQAAPFTGAVVAVFASFANTASIGINLCVSVPFYVGSAVDSDHVVQEKIVQANELSEKMAIGPKVYEPVSKTW